MGDGLVELLLYGAIAALAALIVLWVICLVKLPSQKRPGLMQAGTIAVILILILLAGDWILNMTGLTWRTWIRGVLCLLALLTSLVAWIFVIRAIRHLYHEEKAGLPLWTVRFVVSNALILVMLFAVPLSCLYAFQDEETVGMWQGHKVVQVEAALFTDTNYSVYKYQGLFVRGTESYCWSESSMLDQ